MFPIRDLLPPLHPPFFSRILVYVCAAIFLLTLGSAEQVILQYGAVSAHFTGYPVEGPELIPDSSRRWLRVFTHMFIHAGLFHVVANLWMLWIFGDNVEARFGRLRFLVVYLACGLAALLAQVLAHPSSGVPMVGASGAISGVLGAYLIFFPHARLEVLVLLGWFPLILVIRASTFLIFWFALQILGGMLTSSGTGVAFFAHAGGFIAGVLFARLWAPRRRTLEVPVKDLYRGGRIRLDD